MAHLAIDGGPPVRSAPFPWPRSGEAERAALLDVLASGKWGRVEGSAVEAFEEAFARLHDARFGIATTSGSAALELALKGLGVRPGDEVICPAYTFIATATAVVRVGAVPVFADISPDTLLLDPAAAEAAITPRTRAILPVHIAGHPADLTALRQLADRYGLKILEDAAQAHGARFRGRAVGAIGHAGIFSFQWSKNLTAGEGGIVLTDDEAVADRVYSYHNVGRRRGGAWYEHHLLASNHRMTAFQAALLLAGMQRLPEEMALRDEAYSLLAEEVPKIPGLGVPALTPGTDRSAHHLFLMTYAEEAWDGVPRALVVRALAAEGIPCSPGYNPLYREPVFARLAEEAPDVHARGTPDYPSLQLPVTEQAARTVIWLPQHVLLAGREGARQVLDALDKLYRHRARLAERARREAS